MARESADAALLESACATGRLSWREQGAAESPKKSHLIRRLPKRKCFECGFGCSFITAVFESEDDGGGADVSSIMLQGSTSKTYLTGITLSTPVYKG